MASLGVRAAERIWDVLIEHAGASPDEREAFVRYLTTPERFGHEYRFMGRLGFGGKLYYSPARGPWVACYREDETDERRAIITRVNRGLADL